MCLQAESVEDRELNVASEDFMPPRRARDDFAGDGLTYGMDSRNELPFLVELDLGLAAELVR